MAGGVAGNIHRHGKAGNMGCIGFDGNAQSGDACAKTLNANAALIDGCKDLLL